MKKMSEKEYLDKVKHLAKCLIRLAEEPEPGLASWAMMWGKAFGELSDLWIKGATGTERKAMTYEQKTSASNLIYNLRENLHKQWDAVETKHGFVFVGRMNDGTFYAYAADNVERLKFDSGGMRTDPERCEVCRSDIEECADGTWTHVHEPHHHHPAVLDTES